MGQQILYIEYKNKGRGQETLYLQKCQKTGAFSSFSLLLSLSPQKEDEKHNFQSLKAFAKHLSFL
jgi:hypothetical protein